MKGDSSPSPPIHDGLFLSFADKWIFGTVSNLLSVLEVSGGFSS